MLPARNLELGTEALWWKNELVIQCVSLYIYVPKSVVCKLVDNMPVTLSQIYVETEERKFRHKTLGSSDDFSKFLKTLCYENYVEYL